ncbi:response regulator [Neisseria sicca]|uniref:response regulator n=1 Tax=Neisseria sicca TaxID=490 RepID=UPI0002EAE179|nr:response regulator [Neisseria sicca]
MNKMTLILIEDNDDEAQSCQNAVNDFNDEHKNKEWCIQLVTHNNIEAASKALESSYFDGAIIDMKLADSGDEGNQALDVIRQHLKRIPVAIYTGTPDVADNSDDIPLIDVFKKGDATYKQLIYKFWDIYNTGLTKIMGGKGQIEQSLSQIFIKHLLPRISPAKISPEPTVSEKSNWVYYAEEDPDNTEKALLRHTLNHLIHELYKSSENCYPEEMYIHLPNLEQDQVKVDTGCILQNKDNNKFYIVLSPACDLAEREEGVCNTDRALLVEIQMLEDILSDDYFISNCHNGKKLKKRYLKSNSESPREYLSKQQDNDLIKYQRNTKNLYYCWLPKTSCFNNGAVINFRRVSTYSQEELDKSFNSPVIQVASPFLKDIISRFSSYYARQGQPDININL